MTNIPIDVLNVEIGYRFLKQNPISKVLEMEEGFRDRRRELKNNGELAEWSKARVLKIRGPSGPVGSNPTLSAIIQGNHGKEIN